MRIVDCCFLLAIFLFQFYRAATQSLTVDEAHIYLAYIRPGLVTLLGSYEAGHHVLYSLLEWFLTRFLGYGELVLRLPALAACAAYLIFVHRVTARLTAGAMFRFCAVVLLSSNPLLLDHLMLARGYGLALALFAWALYAAEEDSLVASGLLAGLSVAANLTFLFPVVGLVAVVAWRRTPLETIHRFLGPGAVLAAIILMVPLSHASPGAFYFGAATLTEGLRGVAHMVFARTFFEFGMICGYVATAIGVAAAISFRARKPTIILAVGAGLVLTTHWIFKLPLPHARTALWIIFLVTLITVQALSTLPMRRAAIALCACLAAAQLIQLDPRYAAEWRWDARTKQLLRKLAGHEAPYKRPFSLTGDADYMFPVEYYRLRLNLVNLEAFKLKPPVGYALVFAVDAPKTDGYQRLFYDPVCDCEIGRLTAPPPAPSTSPHP